MPLTMHLLESAYTHITHTRERERMGSNSGVSTPHAVLFPFMSKGHIIPLLHLAHLLLRRQISVTVITTPANRPFIANSLSDTATSIIQVPFPDIIPEIPEGVESTDKLPSMSLFHTFAVATKLMQPHFEKALENMLPVSFLVSDSFLPWTLHSATKFGIPRLAIYGTNKYSMALIVDVLKNGLLSKTESDDESFTVPSFPWIKLTRNDLDSSIRDRVQDREPKGPIAEFFTDSVSATSNSYGILVNSFYELEAAFVDYWNRESVPKAFCAGPLCFAEPQKVEQPQKIPSWLQWLNQNLDGGKSVLYVAFGSQAEMSPEQFKEIAIGLEKSNKNFLWVVREKGCELEDGYEERVKERGIVVREWVNQREILAHESVKGFLSHCGWNSCLESICACVPILAFPLAADQHLNARMLAEEIKIGLRVETCDGSVRGFVKCEELEKVVRELIEGEKGKEVRRRVEEVGEAARKAMEEGGSSCQTLDLLIEELCNKKT